MPDDLDPRRDRYNTPAKRQANRDAASRFYYAHRKSDHDPALLQPVTIQPAPPPDTKQVQAELNCLYRELNTIQRAIDQKRACLSTAR